MQSESKTVPAISRPSVGPSWVLPLEHPDAADPRQSGAKAANLARLLAAGFPVPAGIVVTTAAFEAHSASAGGGQEPGTSIRTAAMPESVATALAGALGRFGDIPLAVRSSGVAEDLAGASFAGQYETVLDVQTTADTMDAVRRCWASAFSRNVASYMQGMNVATRPMAVLIQPMIAAEAAGVAFTANPVTGDRTETVVSAVRGLGDRLVSGQVTPDEWTVRDGKPVRRIATENAIDDQTVLSVAGLARRVEAYFDAPQDIEWAIRDGKLYLLQARPITTLTVGHLPTPFPVPVEPPPGFWQRESVHAPQPWSPMMRFFIPLRREAIRRACDEFGALIETIDFREIGGWEYVRLVPFGGQDGPAPPDWLMWLLVRAVPSMRRRLRRCVAAVRADKARELARRWYEEWRPACAARVADLRAVDLAGLPDADLHGHVRSVRAFVEQGADLHFLLGFLSVTQGELALMCRDLLGWDESAALDMLSGLSEMSTEPAQRLAELAQMARERPALKSLLESRQAGTISDIEGTDAAFAAAFAEYQQTYGCRVLRYEVADRTLAESPGLVLDLIRAQVDRGYDPAAATDALRERRLETVAQARAALAKAPAGDRDRFERSLRTAQLAYPVREDNEFYTISAPLALFRYALLELGQRLSVRGLIDSRDDVFFLDMEEALASFSQSNDTRSLVARRKGERAWVLAHPGPATFGEDAGPPPSFKALPREARSFHEALLWSIDRDSEAEATERGRQQEGGDTLRGIGAAPGEYTGPARIIEDESQFEKLRPGDVLVCPITSPVWSVLFPAVGALVTDTGGVLSHSAIIAREYRVPAVVATGNATRVLQDGQIVTVDGVAGTVRPTGEASERSVAR